MAASYERMAGLGESAVRLGAAAGESGRQPCDAAPHVPQDAADVGIPAFIEIVRQPYMDEDAMTAYSDDPGYIPIMSVSHRTCDRRRVQVSVSRVYR